MKASNTSIEKTSPAPRAVAFTLQGKACPADTHPQSPLTMRECECLSWTAMGNTAAETASALNVSEHTIHFHVKNAIKKLNAKNKTHAVVKAMSAKYITIKVTVA